MRYNFDFEDSVVSQSPSWVIYEYVIYGGRLPSLGLRIRSNDNARTRELDAIKYADQKSNSRSRKVAGMDESEAIFVNLSNVSGTQVGFLRAHVGYSPVKRIVHELQRPRAVHNDQLPVRLTNKLGLFLLVLISY